MISEDKKAKKERMIRERLWQIRKSANEILELTNEDRVMESGEPYRDCNGNCDTCFITDVCHNLVDVAVVDIPGETP
jgi:hypothetical protein